MLKLEFDLSDIASELHEGLKAGLNASIAATADKVKTRGLQIANQKLKSGLKFWSKGFAVDKVGDGMWVISMSGKLANMMEDGFNTGDIKKMLLEGNRARHNSAHGKKYVDVPFAQDADALTGNIGKTQVSVQQFKNADEMVKAITTSNWSKGGVQTEKRIVQRVKDVIKSRETQTSSPQYLTIRRVSEKSKGWPTNPFKGAKVFEQLDHYLEQAFEESLDSLL